MYMDAPTPQTGSTPSRTSAPDGRPAERAVAASTTAVATDGIEAGWVFATDHDQVQACNADEPAGALSDIANRAGVTHQAALRIISDLAGGLGRSFLTEQVQVLVCVAHSRGITSEAIGACTGLDPLRTNRILIELTDAGYVTSQHKGSGEVFQARREFLHPSPIVREQNIGEAWDVLADHRATPSSRDPTPTP